MQTRLRRSWLLGGIVALATVVTLYAQEAQVFNRGIAVLAGNVTVSQGYVQSKLLLRDSRTETGITTTGAATYTAAQVLSGYLDRTTGVGGNVTDVLPTAANLVAAIPGVAANTTFFTVIDMGATPGGSVTLNGASTGVTYGTGCSTAVGTGDVMLLMINITSSTAYRAICLNVNT